MSETYSRRTFLKGLVIGAASLPLVTIGKQNTFAQDMTKPLDLNDSMAQTFGYTHDHTKVDKVKFPKKAGPDGDKQKCSGCVLFLEGGKTIKDTPGEWGKCGLFQNGLVNANGWCNSFAPKA